VNKEIYSNIARFALAGLSVLLVSCSISPGWRDSVREQMDESLSEARTAAPPKDVSKALLPPLELSLPDGKLAPLEPRFDLNVSNAPARQVFLGLVEGSKYSVVVHQDVRGALTLNLKEVTVPDAFESIRRVYGYEYRREGNRFLVLGREMQMRLFNVNYLNLIRMGKSDTRVTAAGLSSTGSAAAGGSTTTSQSGVQVATASHSDFWAELRETLGALIGCTTDSKSGGAQTKTDMTSRAPSAISYSCQGGRNVVVNTQTGIVAVRAMPDELRVIEEYLGATHATVNRQVVLEAKIIEVELNDSFQSGINWARVHNNLTVGQAGGGSTLAGGRPGVNTDTQGTIFDLVPPGALDTTVGTASSAFGGVFSVAYSSNNFAAFVELLKSQGEVQVLSSPRVSTVNNQKAVIKVGTDEFFVIKQDVTQASVVGSVPTITTELAPFFSGISLDVTPQIDENGNINLHIHPAVSAVSEKRVLTGRVSSSFSNEISTALSAIQESDNIVRAQSGQIIVIGGLMKEGTTDENASVPFLGDIPVLGYLFKHKKVTRIKKELVILLKPTVVHLDQDWNAVVGDSQDRIKKIRIDR
jgi:MSHA biogenesis protein MshL